MVDTHPTVVYQYPLTLGAAPGPLENDPDEFKNTAFTTLGVHRLVVKKPYGITDAFVTEGNDVRRDVVAAQRHRQYSRRRTAYDRVPRRWPSRTVSRDCSPYMYHPQSWLHVVNGTVCTADKDDTS